MTNQVQKGDILLYFNTAVHSITWDAIKLGEILEDGKQPREYFHVAIAISGTQKIEADGKTVTTHWIEENGEGVYFDVYRLPFPQEKIDAAVQYIMQFMGEGYDWALIVDDALRYISGGLLHLPTSFIEYKETHEKICSTLAGVYLAQFGIITKRLPSPEDIYLAIKQYRTTPTTKFSSSTPLTNQQV